MVNIETAVAVSATPAFRDLEDVYYADTCEPLSAAASQGKLQMKALARGHYPGARLPEDAVEGVRTVGFWDAPSRQDWGLDWHRNEGIEITFLARGSAAFSADGGCWKLQPGQLTITRPWQRHRLGDPFVGPSRLHWLILDVGVRRPNHRWRWPDWINLAGRDLTRLTRLLQHCEHPVWPANKAVHDTFEALADVVSGPESLSLQSRMRVLLCQLLLELLDLLEDQSLVLDEGLASPRRGVQLFLDELPNYIDRKWTLADMAEACGMGRTQFSAYCQELTNMSPIEFLTRKRMDFAAQLLRENVDLSVTEIAFQCGFESNQYFSTTFRRNFGASPREWRMANCTPTSRD